MINSESQAEFYSLFTMNSLCDLGGINITSLGSIKSYIIKIKNWKLIVTLIVYFEVRVYRWKYIIKK